jgi:hypothetical protein
MKNKTQILILLLVIVSLAACRYDEGPMISFRTMESRVAQDFELVEFTKNDDDITQELADSCGELWYFKTSHESGGKSNLQLECSTTTSTNIGQYEILSSKKNINIYIFYGTISYIGIEPFKKNVETTWKIERLTKKDFWLSCTYNNADYYLKLKANEN